MSLMSTHHTQADSDSAIPDPMLRPTVTVSEAALVLGISRGAAFRADQTQKRLAIRIGIRLLVPTAGLRRT